MRRHDPAATKQQFHAGLRALAQGPLRPALRDLVAEDVRWSACHPIGEVQGLDAVADRIWRPIRQAFADLERRDDVLIGGTHHGQDWIAATGHYFGVFAGSYLGIPPHGGWAWLRFGEFYRLEEGRAVQAYTLFDLPDLLRQAGVPALRPGRGMETLTPGPATRDGVRLGMPSTAESATTLDLIERMLGPLFEPDRASMGMERFWTPGMMWYGPCGIGATRGLDGFFRHHTDPWIAAIPDWRADLDTPHFADDAYAAFVGWPSIEATQTGELLGLPPTGRRVEINLMDFWRREGGLLAENWVLIDFPHLFSQLGVDLFAQLPALAGAGPRVSR